MIIIKAKQVALATTIGFAGTMLLTSAKASADTITIQSGDTVWGLSQKYNVSMGEIIQANHLQNPNLIYAGDSLYIPTSAAKSVTRTPVSASSSVASQAPAASSQASVTTSVSAVSGSVSSSANVATSSVNSVATTSANSVDSRAATSDSSANNILPTNIVALQTNGSSSVPSANAATSAGQVTSAATTTTTTNSNVTASSAVSTNTTATSSAATSSATTTTVNSATSTSTTTTTATSTNGLTTYSSSEAISRAQSVIGTPYVYGGNTTSGFDCSGLVQWSYGLSGSYRTTYQQQALGTHHYDIANAPAGAIYFWGSDSAPYHDAIALGNGSYIAAPDVGQTVKTETISEFTPSYYVVIGE